METSNPMLRYVSSRSFNLTTRFSCGLRRAGHVKIKNAFYFYQYAKVIFIYVEYLRNVHHNI